MTLNEAKILLEKHRIPCQTAQYESEAEYWRHCMPVPNTKNARNCEVLALVIPSVNGVKDIELQFNRVRGEFVFQELWFGSYGFELFDTREEYLPGELMEEISSIVDGKTAIIDAVDLKRRRWWGDCCFDLTDDDVVFGKPGFEESLRRIEAPKTLWQKLRGTKKQYDIYDWRTHRQIVK